MKQVQTDNSFLDAKVQLRAETLPDQDTLHVLDAYSGQGTIWKQIKATSAKKIQITRIDTEDVKGVYLKGDNLKYLNSIDLTKYDIVDLDAYGIPYKQLQALFNRGFKGTIYITFIQTLYGQLNKGLLNAIGYTDEMIDKIPTLFNKEGFKKFKQYLATKGIREMKHISIDNKHYISITL